MGKGQNVPASTKGFSFPRTATFQTRASLWLAFGCDSYLVPIWSIRSLCGPHIIIHSSEICMLALPDPGPCLVPMWSYLSSPIMVPMCFLCDPFEVLALSILVHPWSARSQLRDSYKVPNRSWSAWFCPVPFLVPFWSLPMSHRIIFNAPVWLQNKIIYLRLV